MQPKQPKFRSSRRRGFTLVELLVVITIIIVLALLTFVLAQKFLEKGKKVQALSQIRDLKTGLHAFSVDYQHGPIPREKLDQGLDTVYGDPDALYQNNFVMGALIGDPSIYDLQGSSFDPLEANPRKEKYLEMPLREDKVNGVSKEGILYDPWGNSMIMAINTPPYRTENSSGSYDRVMWTFEVGEYSDTKPREEDFVIWSFGKDKKKGKNGGSKTAIIPYQGSDDVISWE